MTSLYYGNSCWVCCGEGVEVRRTPYGKRVVKCPACEERRLVREYKERERQMKKQGVPTDE